MFLLANKAGQELSFGMGTSWHSAACVRTAEPSYLPKQVSCMQPVWWERPLAHTDPRAVLGAASETAGLLGQNHAGDMTTEKTVRRTTACRGLSLNPGPVWFTATEVAVGIEIKKGLQHKAELKSKLCILLMSPLCSTDSSFKAIFDSISKLRHPLCSFVSSFIGRFPWTTNLIFLTNAETGLGMY